MKIGVIGLGYIGSVTAAVLAYRGHEVTAVDNVETKVNAFKNGTPPIYEPGLAKMLNDSSRNMNFSNSYSALEKAEICFIAVPTPNLEGRIDLSYVYSAVTSLKDVNPICTVVMKSTVVPGTAKQIFQKTGMTIISNPEFTREGSAILDTTSPDRVVIGGSDKKAVDLVSEIWNFTGSPVIKTTNENAELIKYASNAFLATKISFINEFANLCEKLQGADVETVAKGMGLDKRIGEKFLKAGIGYGGSCFPKDTLAISAFAREMGAPLKIVEASSQVNDTRIDHAVSIIKAACADSLSSTRIGILGIAFKDNTDDLRESQSLKLINALVELGARISVYDPVVKKRILGVTRTETADECITASDVVIVATEWPEFKKLPESARDKIVIDVRRILNPADYPNFFAVGYGNAED